MNLLKQVLVATLVLLAGLPPALAQTYPDKLIKMVVPFPAGSTVDALARFMAEELRKGLGQTVIVENQAGADGILAAQTVKRAAPDGYTIMMSTSSPHAANPALVRVASLRSGEGLRAGRDDHACSAGTGREKGSCRATTSQVLSELRSNRAQSRSTLPPGTRRATFWESSSSRQRSST